MSIFRKSYLDGPFGQTHIHIWGDFEKADEIVICLPPSPYSGAAYKTLAPFLVSYGCVIAIDYPVFKGGKRPSIRDYAKVVNGVIEQLEHRKSVSLIGFHTGCLVAVEASLTRNQPLDQMILIDVPFFAEEKRKELMEKSIGYFPISDDLNDLKSAWDMSVTRQKGKVSAERSFEMFVDHISGIYAAGDPFAAAFSYDSWRQFPQVTAPCTVIATQAGLYNESVKAAKVIPQASLIQVDHIKESVLEASSSDVAELIKACLNR